MIGSALPGRGLDVTLPIKRTLVVVGRNLEKHKSYNRKLTGVKIVGMILGFKVIDLTVRPVQHQFFPKIESLSLMTSDYTKWVRSMMDATAVVSIGNAGGISTTLAIECNLIVYGRGGWIDNANFGFQGQTLIRARNEFFSSKMTVHLRYFPFLRLLWTLVQLVLLTRDYAES